MDSTRIRKGKYTMSNLQKNRDKRPPFGFNAEFKGANHVVDQAVVLPITTRGIGFFTQIVFAETQQTVRKLPQCTPYQLYRVSLAQHEARCLAVQSRQFLPYANDFADYARPNLTLDQRDVITGTTVNFSLITNAINAIGNFEHNDTTYYPKVPSNHNQPIAHLVTFSNLRQTVVQMAQRETTQEQRLAFYNSNPLPFARWGPGAGGHPDWPILENPEDFMPDDYGIEDLEKDCNCVRNHLKSVKYGYEYRNNLICFESGAVGSPALLISNYGTELRNPDTHPGEINYREAPMPKGDLASFWAPCKLKSSMAFQGALLLSGEIPSDGLPQSVYGVRNLTHARIRHDHRWKTVLTTWLNAFDL